MEKRPFCGPGLTPRAAGSKPPALKLLVSVRCRRVVEVPELTVARRKNTGATIKDVFTSSWERKRDKTLHEASFGRNMSKGIFEVAGEQS